MNAPDTVAEWAGRIDAQLRRFVDIDESPTGALVVNNLEWTGQLSAIEFLRDLGKHFSVNVMLARDTVKRRLEGGRHQLRRVQLPAPAVQRLRRAQSAVRLPPADRWLGSVGGNIVGGVDLGRRLDGVSLHALTVPLVTSSDGKKFGKSTGGGSLWLDPELTSPYAWYQYFVNTADADVIRYLRWFTFLGREEIAELEQATEEKPHLRLAQKKLAAEMTTLIHGQGNTRAVELASQALFGRAELDELDESTLAAAVGGDRHRGVRAGATHDHPVARRHQAVREQQGCASCSVRGRRVREQHEDHDPEWQPADSDLLHGRWLVVRRGKKSFAGARLGR